MYNRQLTLIGLAVAVFASGCSSAPKAIRNDSDISFDEYPQITPLEDLHRCIKLSKVVEDPGPPMRLNVIVRHDEREDVIRHIQYRYFFTDDAGVPENSNPDWHYLAVEPRVLAYLQGNALDSKSSKWRLEIRPGR